MDHTSAPVIPEQDAERLVGADRVLADPGRAGPARRRRSAWTRWPARWQQQGHRAPGARRRCAGPGSPPRTAAGATCWATSTCGWPSPTTRPGPTTCGSAHAATLAERYGETAHYAVLDGGSVVYRSKVDPPRGAVRLTSTIGGRNPAHCTAVGKLLLAYALPDDAAVRGWVGRAHPGAPHRAHPGHRRRAGRRAADRSASAAGRRRPGERARRRTAWRCRRSCISPTVPTGAVSVSAPAYRTPLSRLVAEVDTIRRRACDPVMRAFVIIGPGPGARCGKSS